MAVSFLNAEVSELCLGKPDLKGGVAAASTVCDAVTAMKRSGQTHLSVWSSSACVGKISLADVILFLCRKENSGDPLKALDAPVSDLLPKGVSVVRHLDSNSSLFEVIDCIIEGTQKLVIPIENHRIPGSRRKFNNKPGSQGHGYCWLSHEDVIRFLLNSIGAFAPIPTFAIETLDVIDGDIMAVQYSSPAASALNLFNRALVEQVSIAVVDENNRLIGEISPFTLACCDETVAPAIMALSAGDLMAYVDCCGPPEELVHLVKTRLKEMKLGGMLDFMDEVFGSSSSSSSCSSCSSDDESWSTRSLGPGGCYPGRKSEAIICTPKSSLVAVMIQALTHRVSCVWVVEKDYTLVGAVTFSRMLEVLRNVAGGNMK